MSIKIEKQFFPDNDPNFARGTVITLRTERLRVSLGWIPESDYGDGVPWCFENYGGVGPLRWSWYLKPQLIF